MTTVSSSWNTTTKRRRFFESFAKLNHFDPRDPHAWYRVPRRSIMALKVIKLMNMAL